MKTNFTYLFIGFLLGAFLINRCSKNEIETIKTPEKIGLFYEPQIKHIPIEIPIEVPKWYKDTKTEKELKYQVQEAEKRIKIYEKEVWDLVTEFYASDSIQKIDLFKKATELKKFENVFEDDNTIVNTYGIVQGEIKEIQTFYKIKSQLVSIPKKDKKFSLNAGAGLDFNATTPVLKMGVGYKNYNFDYLKINNQNYGVISYEIKF